MHFVPFGILCLYYFMTFQTFYHGSDTELMMARCCCSLIIQASRQVVSKLVLLNNKFFQFWFRHLYEAVVTCAKVTIGTLLGP